MLDGQRAGFKEKQGSWTVKPLLEIPWPFCSRHFVLSVDYRASLYLFSVYILGLISNVSQREWGDIPINRLWYYPLGTVFYCLFVLLHKINTCRESEGMRNKRSHDDLAHVSLYQCFQINWSLFLLIWDVFSEAPHKRNVSCYPLSHSALFSKNGHSV